MPVLNCQKVACGFVGIVSFAALGMGIAGLIPRGLEFPTGVASGLTGGGGLALMGLVALAKSNCYSSKTRSEADNPPLNALAGQGGVDIPRGRSRNSSSFSDEKDDGFGGPGSVARRRLSASSQEDELAAAKKVNLWKIYQIMNDDQSISDLRNPQKIGQEVPPALIDKWNNDVWPKACSENLSEYSWCLGNAMNEINHCLNNSDKPQFSDRLLSQAVNAKKELCKILH